MKICAACHANLPKESYSKKQWKLDEYQRRCKVCITNNREVRPPPQHDNNDSNTNEVIKALDSMYLKNIEEKISDEKLFKQPPPKEDCPICFLRLPTLDTGWRYKSCCGKVICSGCIHAPVYDNQGNEVDNKKCPFCRSATPDTNEETIEREKKRMEVNDPIAISKQGIYYRDGTSGYPQDYGKALDLFYRASELGHATAYANIGYAYDNGEGVEVDTKKGVYYYELAAVGGNEVARYNLGVIEESAGNIDRAIKHYMISTRSGDPDSLKEIKELYSNGHATKEDYTKALRTYQTYLGEIKSRQRDEAAAADHDYYRYY